MKIWLTMPSISPKEVFDYFKGGEYTDADGESYMEWGWWEDPGAASPIGAYGAPDYKYYALSQKIWQIQGTRTHPDYLDYLQTQGAVYTYSGETKGVIACDGGIFAPAEVSGTFSCDIDFGSRDLSQFKIDATGPAGYEVHLSGSGSVSAEGDLDLDTLGGTIKGGSCPTENTLDSLTGAQGAVMGKQADGVGGYWHAGGDQGYALGAGEFHAER